MSIFMSTRARWRRALLALLLLLPALTWADTPSGDSIKAGFILNFAKFTDWPPSASGGGRLLVCSLGPQPLSGNLEALQGRIVQGREVQVRASTPPNELRECQVLFIAANEEPRVEWLLKHLARLPVLTISDVPNFAYAGGVIGLFEENNKLRFDINLTAARQNNLTLSSNLLRLARTVKQ